MWASSSTTTLADPSDRRRRRRWWRRRRVLSLRAVSCSVEIRSSTTKTKGKKGGRTKQKRWDFSRSGDPVCAGDCQRSRPVTSDVSKHGKINFGEIFTPFLPAGKQAHANLRWRREHAELLLAAHQFHCRLLVFSLFLACIVWVCVARACVRAF